jgi:stage III sporulation protein AG
MTETGPRTNWQNILKNATQNRTTLWILLGIVALGIILLLTGNDKGGTTSLKPPPDNQSSLYNAQESTTENSVSVAQQLSDELARTLEAIDGVGSVKVKVNLRSRSRKIWERQARVNKRVSQEQGAINTEDDSNDELVFAKDRDGSERPVLKEELAPVIEGVIVVAEGAQDIKIKHLLIETVTTVLGIPAHRVMVLPGK